VKEALFSMIQMRLAGAVVVDAFAGNGALGIEALSRGASRVYFVEKDPEARAVIARNLALLGETDRARIVDADALHPRRWGIEGEVDLILADPPYREGLVEPFLDAVLRAGTLAGEGMLAVEHEKGLSPRAPGLVRLRVRRHGETEISLWATAPPAGGG
jgi:16S rRNA (guanine966-N2)-methyltransferase